jgi:hypothetical protein
VTGKTKDPDAILSRGNRHLFLVPWRDQLWWVCGMSCTAVIRIRQSSRGPMIQAFYR